MSPGIDGRPVNDLIRGFYKRHLPFALGLSIPLGASKTIKNKLLLARDCKFQHWWQLARPMINDLQKRKVSVHRICWANSAGPMKIVAELQSSFF
jgi:hypothetical protein